MNNKLIITLIFCAVAMLAWVSSGFSWTLYSGGCGDCHGEGFVGFAHGTHSAFDCSSCHASPGDSPATINCAECHAPGGDPVECPLVIDHEDSPAYDSEGLSCLTCHVTCDEPEPECEDDADCDDELYCNGIEFCSLEGSVTVCVPGEEPCEEGQECEEENDVCFDPAACEEDADCDDTDPCTNDACVEDACVNTAVDCGADVCNPVDGECVECLIADDCKDGATCIDNMCTVSECPEGTPDQVLRFDVDGDCRLNKDELKNYKQTLNVEQKAERIEMNARHKIQKQEYKAIKINYSTK